MSGGKYYGWNLPFSLIGVGVGIAVGIALENVAVGISIGAGLALMFGLVKPFRRKDQQDADSDSSKTESLDGKD